MYHNDVVARKGGAIFNIQAKNTAIALNGSPRTLENWIGAALKKDGKGSVRIMVPAGVQPAPRIMKILQKNGLDWNTIKIMSSPS